ncbi:glycosyltransferase family protein [Microbacterium testaceum]|uniref:glycosyltransferase family protein n=1 Tax=Microbacterium testaceum TaxID=2033 RepID=UPI000A91AC95|nr:hypothetical protein [Microbacterium testaceum]
MVRILYVPNEHGEHRQFGIRSTLGKLRAAGLVTDVKIFSLLWRIREGLDAPNQRKILLQVAEEYRADIVLLQHLGGTGISREDLRRLRGSCGFMIYHEADPYSRYVHALPREARLAGQLSDVVFTVGNGVFADNFRRAGAVDVRWEPSIFDPGRFGHLSVEPEMVRTFDVVMVANRNKPRLRGLPNWRDRIAFVEYMEQRFGPRFAIFGRGWTGPSAQGQVPYSEQASAIRSGWVSANWDHFAKEPLYFSDRLPTSLATGSVHATTAHAGFRDYFIGADKFLLLSENFADLADRIEVYLQETEPEDRLLREREARKYAHDNLRQDDQLIRMLNHAGAAIDVEKYQTVRSSFAHPIEEV